MQTNLMGILAGMGPRSTAPFIDLVVNECQRQYGAQHDIDFPPMLIYSLPTPFYLDRPLDHRAMEATICAGLQHLERSGAALIAMPCNTAHIYYAQLTRSIQIPLLNMIDLALQQVPSSTQRIALLATQPTVEAKLYQPAINRMQFELVAQTDWQAQANRLIHAIKTGQNLAQTQMLWHELLTAYEAAGVDTVLIGCTDVTPLTATYAGALTLLDATQCLAAGLVAQWRQL